MADVASHRSQSGLYVASLIGSLLDAAAASLLVRVALRCGARPWAAALGGLLYAAYPVAVVYFMVLSLSSHGRQQRTGC
jgi:hypothetical protein